MCGSILRIFKVSAFICYFTKTNTGAEGILALVVPLRPRSGLSSLHLPSPSGCLSPAVAAGQKVLPTETTADLPTGQARCTPDPPPPSTARKNRLQTSELRVARTTSRRAGFRPVVKSEPAAHARVAARPTRRPSVRSGFHLAVRGLNCFPLQALRMRARPAVLHMPEKRVPGVGLKRETWLRDIVYILSGGIQAGMKSSMQTALHRHLGAQSVSASANICKVCEGNFDATPASSASRFMPPAGRLRSGTYKACAQGPVCFASSLFGPGCAPSGTPCVAIETQES